MKYSLRYKGLIRVEFYWTFHFPASNSINPYLWKNTGQQGWITALAATLSIH